MTTETTARATFAQAERDLQAAITAYSKTRRTLHAVTGEFFGCDDAQLRNFTAGSGHRNTGADSSMAKTDC